MREISKAHLTHHFLCIKFLLRLHNYDNFNGWLPHYPQWASVVHTPIKGCMVQTWERWTHWYIFVLSSSIFTQLFVVSFILFIKYSSLHGLLTETSTFFLLLYWKLFAKHYQCNSDHTQDLTLSEVSRVHLKDVCGCKWNILQWLFWQTGPDVQTMWWITPHSSININQRERQKKKWLQERCRVAVKFKSNTPKFTIFLKIRNDKVNSNRLFLESQNQNMKNVHWHCHTHAVEYK